MDANRKGIIEVNKFTLQKRHQTIYPLIRVDIDGAPHMNPDGLETSRNHIHIYREEQGDTGNLPWAFDLPVFDELYKTNFAKQNDFSSMFLELCKFCNINSAGVQHVL